MEDFFRNLTNIIKDNQNIIIMTHKNPDLDGLSSGILLQKIIESFNINVYLYDTSDKLNRSVIKMYEKLEENKINIKKLKKPPINNVIDENTLLIVLDVNNIKLLEDKDILNRVKKVIVIDHHIRTKTSIKNSVYTYINSNLSSIAELMTNYAKYLNKKIEPIIATILLAAIEIDSNSFNIKTTENTYKTAAYLLKIGANNIDKQELLKESKEEYIKRSDLIKNSYMHNKDTAICLLDSEIYDKSDLATISEELLQFEDVEIAITIGRTSEKKVGASARSIGNINVEEIMKQLGGGGHLYEAATEQENIDIKQLLEKLIKVIES